MKAPRYCPMLKRQAIRRLWPGIDCALGVGSRPVERQLVLLALTISSNFTTGMAEYCPPLYPPNSCTSGCCYRRSAGETAFGMPSQCSLQAGGRDHVVGEGKGITQTGGGNGAARQRIVDFIGVEPGGPTCPYKWLSLRRGGNAVRGCRESKFHLARWPKSRHCGRRRLAPYR